MQPDKPGNAKGPLKEAPQTEGPGTPDGTISVKSLLEQPGHIGWVNR